MGFKPDLDDQLQCFHTVGLAIWPVKIVPEMTYNVSSAMLSLYTTTTDLVLQSCVTDAVTHVTICQSASVS